MCSPTGSTRSDGDGAAPADEGGANRGIGGRACPTFD